MVRKSFVIIAFVLAALAPVLSAQAQFGRLGGLGQLIRGVAAPALPDIFSGPQPITTNITDALWSDPSRDRFIPPMAVRPLTSLARTSTGGFRLQPGYYDMLAQSYCLHAGTHGPSVGDGYLYAPVKGSAKDEVISILQNSVAFPEISQHDIQLLLWAIIAQAKFEDLDSALKYVASRLLTPRQIAGLNRSALDILGSSQMRSITGDLPGPLRAIVQAEAQMREIFGGGRNSYADIERVAMLAGVAPIGAGSVNVPSSRWSHHPDGYWVRYRPNSYTNTKIEIYVEPDSIAVGRDYDPGKEIAVPGNTSKQRLSMSGRVYDRR